MTDKYVIEFSQEEIKEMIVALTAAGAFNKPYMEKFRIIDSEHYPKAVKWDETFTRLKTKFKNILKTDDKGESA